MADKTYYVWSPIHYHDREGNKKILAPGKEVTAEKIQVDEDGWANLLEGGSVRTTPYPEGLDPKNPNALSPNEHRLRELRIQREKLEAEMAGVGGEAGDINPSVTDEDVEPPADDGSQGSIFGGGR